MDLCEYNITISDDALSMLDQHARLLANVNQNAAKKFVDKVLKDIESLESLPERCPFYENPFIPEKRYRMLLSNKRYIILYEILEGTVFVDFIIDCRKDNIND